MTREEAANWLEHYCYGNTNILRDCADDIAEKIQTAMDEAIAALRQPVVDWVRTADRLPTEAELGQYGHLRVCDKDGHTGLASYAELRLYPRKYPYWHPLLKAPQDAEKEEPLIPVERKQTCEE